MHAFQSLFGLNPSHIQKTCVLIPFMIKNLLRIFEIRELTQGNLYSTGSDDFLTVIQCKMGSPFVGDAVLYLNDTRCQNIIFLGSCGSVNTSSPLKLGDLVLPTACLSAESFSQVLKHDLLKCQKTAPGSSILNKFSHFQPAKNTRNVNAITFGSLKLESENKKFFKKNNIDVIDLETSALFNAAESINKQALALLYITDMIGQKPFYSKTTAKEQSMIHAGIDQALLLIKNFAKHLN